MGKILIVNSFRLLFVGHKTTDGHTFFGKKKSFTLIFEVFEGQ